MKNIFISALTFVFAFFSFPVHAKDKSASIQELKAKIRALEAQIETQKKKQVYKSQSRPFHRAAETQQKPVAQPGFAVKNDPKRAQQALAMEENRILKTREEAEQIRREREAFEKRVAARRPGFAMPVPREPSEAEAKSALQREEERISKEGILGPRDGFINGVPVGPAAAARTREEIAALRAEREAIEKRHAQRLIEIAQREKDIEALKAKMKAQKEKEAQEKQELEALLQRNADTLRKTRELLQGVNERQQKFEADMKEFEAKYITSKQQKTLGTQGASDTIGNTERGPQESASATSAK